MRKEAKYENINPWNLKYFEIMYQKESLLILNKKNLIKNELNKKLKINTDSWEYLQTELNKRESIITKQAKILKENKINNIKSRKYKIVSNYLILNKKNNSANKSVNKSKLMNFIHFSLNNKKKKKLSFKLSMLDRVNKVKSHIK